MKYLRGALGVLVGGGSAGIVFGLFADWFNPCVGMSRFEPCAIDASTYPEIIPCYMGVCDVWAPAWFKVLQHAIMLALFAGAGFVAALFARHWYRRVGALAAMFVVPVTIALSEYLFPYGPPGRYTFLHAIALLMGLAIVGAIGIAGGWLARRLTKPAAAAQ